LDCEFTNPRAPGDQRTAVLQLSLASETLVFQICHADEVAPALKEFLQDRNIKFFSAAIGNDVKMLRHYDIRITSAYDLQKLLPNPTNKPTPSPYYLTNYTIGTNLEKKKKKKYKKMDVAAQKEEEDELIF
jgi:ribonuclease D